MKGSQLNIIMSLLDVLKVQDSHDSVIKNTVTICNSHQRIDLLAYVLVPLCSTFIYAVCESEGQS